jgi:hypothetical protein
MRPATARMNHKLAHPAASHRCLANRLTRRQCKEFQGASADALGDGGRSVGSFVLRSGLFVKAVGWEPVWYRERGSSSSALYVWQPVSPSAEYVAVGHVVTVTPTMEPDADAAYRLIHKVQPPANPPR